MKDDRSLAEIEFWRSATPDVKMSALQCLIDVTRDVIAADVRLRYPKWTDAQIKEEALRVFKNSTDEDLEFMARYPRYIGNVRRN